jgi:hypothetical protein
MAEFGLRSEYPLVEPYIVFRNGQAFPLLSVIVLQTLFF